MPSHETPSNSTQQTPATNSAPSQFNDSDESSLKGHQRNLRIAQIVWALIYISWTAYLIYVAVQIQKQ